MCPHPPSLPRCDVGLCPAGGGRARSLDADRLARVGWRGSVWRLSVWRGSVGAGRLALVGLARVGWRWSVWVGWRGSVGADGLARVGWR